MKAFSSTLVLLVLIVFLAYPDGLDPALAQSGGPDYEKLDLAEPYREFQYAFANGFKMAVKHIYEEMKAERMDLEKLSKLATNKTGRLRDLTLKMAAEYQATLIKLNAAKQNRPADR